MLKKNITSFVFLISIMLTQFANANEVALLFGLIQPIMFKGGNVEVNYMTDKFVFEYSHGWSPQISEFKESLTKEEKDQNLKIYTPYSTGGGVGYRFTSSFHTNLEYKVHRFEVTNSQGEQANYTVTTLGLGFYYHWKPFSGSSFVVVPGIRYWPTINTTLTDNKTTFSNGEVHEAHGFEVAPNVKLGWIF